MNAVIVGATSGIGRELAREMLAHGWNIGVAGRRTALLDTLAQEAPERVTTATIDVCDTSAPDQLLQLIEKMGKMDVFVLCAGAGAQNPQLDLGVELPVLKTNVEGFTRMVDTAFNYFRSQPQGHIAIISSIAGTKGLGVATAYSASKRFQSHYLDALEQLAYSNRIPIRFTDIRPGFVRTAFLNQPESYPMLLSATKVARKAFRAILCRKRVAIIDFRYAVLVFFWKWIPRCLWKKLRLKR